MGRNHAYAILLVAACATLTSCGEGINGNVTATQSGASTVNGSVTVPPGLQSGAVETVNGSIDIGDNATVSTGSTVNGSIRVGAHARADSLSTVNGAVTLGEGAQVAHGVRTVNGGLILKNSADVAGGLRNVNGHIALTAAHVAGGLRTVSGNIDLAGGSHVEGGILVEQASGWFNWNGSKPRIVIGPGAVVQGELRFERPVQLYVSDTASVGPIIGATAIHFSGEHPPQ
jgi:DUF4097 and DUF4098 domain-containing protein YvlB